MPSIRKTPFGYQVRCGNYAIVDSEADAVRRIYKGYAAGASYKSLTEMLNASSVLYDVGKTWNKNMIARILSDSRYIGGDYPAIISTEQYREVQAILSMKTSNNTPNEYLTTIAQKTICGICGAKVSRRNGFGYWRCHQCSMEKIKLPEQSVTEKVSSMLQVLIANPSLVQVPSHKADDVSKLMRLENELTRELDNPDHSLEKARSLAMQIASEKYVLLDNSKYETERIRIALESSSNNMPEVLISIVSQVILYPDQAIAIRLKNEQIIKE